jgi:hypothetical protein
MDVQMSVVTIILCKTTVKVHQKQQCEASSESALASGHCCSRVRRPIDDASQGKSNWRRLHAHHADERASVVSLLILF